MICGDAAGFAESADSACGFLPERLAVVKISCDPGIRDSLWKFER